MSIIAPIIEDQIQRVQILYVCIVYFHLVHITIKGLRIDLLRNIVYKVSILNRYWENSDEGLLPEP